MQPVIKLTRMHSSRMRTERGSSHLRRQGWSDPSPPPPPPSDQTPTPKTRQPPQEGAQEREPLTPTHGQNDTCLCENITFPASLRYAVGKYRSCTCNRFNTIGNRNIVPKSK